MFTACDETRATDSIILRTPDGRMLTYQVDYARTPAEKSQGLMFVEDMPDDYGMVFVNNPADISKFWMHNTLIPLDMLFFDEENRLIHVEHSAVPHDISPRGPDVPVCRVVELKGGQARANKIETGTVLIENNDEECLPSPYE